MKIEYILFAKKIKVERKKVNEISVYVKDSPIKILRTTFSNIIFDDEEEDYEDSENSGNLTVDNLHIDISLKEYARQNLHYLTLKSEKNGKDVLKIMEDIDKKICSAFEKQYIVITSYDSISEYYCNKIYNKLNSFERKLRLLLFNIYTFSYGINFYENSLNNDMRTKISQRRDKSVSTSANEIEKLKQSLYQLEYSDIIDLLFTPRWTNEDEKKIEEIISTIKSSKGKTNNAIIKNIKDIRPKSDWERIFQPLIGNINNIQNQIEELRELRNKVAHCKFFRENDYNRSSNIIRYLNRKVEKANKLLMNKDFSRLNLNYMIEVIEQTGKIISKGLVDFSKSLLKITSSIISNIVENNENIVRTSKSELKRITKVKKLSNTRFYKRLS